MRNDILSLFENNAKITAEEIAVYLGFPEAYVRSEIKKLEEEQIICGYGTFINRERTDSEFLTALIEEKVTPSRGKGFNRIAEGIRCQTPLYARRVETRHHFTRCVTTFQLLCGRQ